MSQSSKESDLVPILEVLERLTVTTDILCGILTKINPSGFGKKADDVRLSLGDIQLEIKSMIRDYSD